MKYMIILAGSHQHYEAMAGRGSAEAAVWSEDELNAMFGFMNELNDDLRARGEWVDGQGLADPALTRRVELKDGEPIITDGPYPESKEVLAGFWLVDVESIDRATEIAAYVLTCPGPGGGPSGDVIDIRQVQEGASE